MQLPPLQNSARELQLAVAGRVARMQTLLGHLQGFFETFDSHFSRFAVNLSQLDEFDPVDPPLPKQASDQPDWIIQTLTSAATLENFANEKETEGKPQRESHLQHQSTKKLFKTAPTFGQTEPEGLMVGSDSEAQQEAGISDFGAMTREFTVALESESRSLGELLAQLPVQLSKLNLGSPPSQKYQQKAKALKQKLEAASETICKLTAINQLYEEQFEKLTTEAEQRARDQPRAEPRCHNCAFFEETNRQLLLELNHSQLSLTEELANAQNTNLASKGKAQKYKIKYQLLKKARASESSRLVPGSGTNPSRKFSGSLLNGPALEATMARVLAHPSSPRTEQPGFGKTADSFQALRTIPANNRTPLKGQQLNFSVDIENNLNGSNRIEKPQIKIASKSERALPLAKARPPSGFDSAQDLEFGQPLTQFFGNRISFGKQEPAPADGLSFPPQPNLSSTLFNQQPVDGYPNCFVAAENPGALKTAFSKNKDCRNLFHVLDTPNGIYFDPPRSNLIDEDNLVCPDKWGVTTQQADNNGRGETKEPANGQSALLENFLSFSRNEAE